jgi:hypothetical protein
MRRSNRDEAVPAKMKIPLDLPPTLLPLASHAYQPFLQEVRLD